MQHYLFPTMPKPTPRIRKQKARRRAQEATNSSTINTDSNELEILPSHDAEREERKRLLHEELQAQKLEQSRMNPKKKKRLDKYVDNKVKKEENLDLIKKLAAQKIDTSLLRSSKRLGTVNESKRDQLGRVLREKRAGLDVGNEEAILWKNNPTNKNASDFSDESDASSDESNSTTQSRTDHPAENLQPPADSFGSGLKRPLEVDANGKPILQRRKKIKLQKPGWESQDIFVSGIQKDYSDWEGFDSESDEDEVDVNWTRGEVSPNGAYKLDSKRGSSPHEIVEDNFSETSSEEQEGVPSMDLNDTGPLQERASAFKSWASQQRNEAIGFIPTTNINDFKNKNRHAEENINQHNTGDKASRAPGLSAKFDSAKSNASNTGPIIDSTMPVSTREIFNVPVKRSPAMEESRLSLPVVAEEQSIMEAIHTNDIVILWGATGSGKTTQLPQFLFEAGYGNSESPHPGMIGVTQPRRVAAVSMSKRVADELGEHGNKVSYQIRYDSTIHRNTAIKFMTDGVLIRELSQDFLLSKYSAIILDEAHERSINTDILIGMLSRIVETRANLSQKTVKIKPLKLIIMSATLRTADLIDNTSLFRRQKPTIIRAEGRQYPVTIHFARRTQRDYVEETFQKLKLGHRKLPAGAILVFLTGQNEISAVSKKLKQEFASTDESSTVDSRVRISAAEASIEDEDLALNGFNSDEENDFDRSDSEPEITGVDNDEEKEFNISDDPKQLLKVHVLPLYSQLSPEQQMKVFQPPPEGSRLIILATNVAETSLTIPNVRYVFDCGRAKEKRYDKDTGVQTFDVDWISKASANQRSGRAGRTGPGHCYRLYSSAVYERDFAEFAVPEILRTPIEGLVLQLKALGIPNVSNFPFPTPPDRTSLANAEKLLEYLGAISHGSITETGKELVVYPLSPRLSRIIVMAQRYNITNHALALVAALTVSDLFIPQNQLDITTSPAQKTDNDSVGSEQQGSIHQEQRRKEYSAFHAQLSRLDRSSDAMKLLATMYDYFSNSGSGISAETGRYVRVKALREAQQLRQQLQDIARIHEPETSSFPALDRIPNNKTIGLLNQLVAAGYIDQIAMRADLSPTPPPTTRKPKNSTDVPYLTLFPSWPPNTQTIISAQEDEKSKVDAELRLKSVFIHPSSVLTHLSPSKLPQFLVYSHLSRPSNMSSTEAMLELGPRDKVPKTRMHPLAPVAAGQLVALASGTPLLEDGKPIGKIETLNRDSEGRERRRVACVPFLRPGKTSGDLGWPLPPARTAVQRRERGGGWVVEKFES